MRYHQTMFCIGKLAGAKKGIFPNKMLTRLPLYRK